MKSYQPTNYRVIKDNVYVERPGRYGNKAAAIAHYDRVVKRFPASAVSLVSDSSSHKRVVIKSNR